MSSIQELVKLTTVVKKLQKEANELFLPPEEGAKSKGQLVIARSIVSKTRGYIERIANQANGAYEAGYYDACAVMMRRLLETVIIEAYEQRGLDATIKTPSGDFIFLRDLIAAALAESTWNLSRNTRKALPHLKELGDKSAHSRYYLAQRDDIDKQLGDFRTAVQEFIMISGVQKH